MADGTPQTGIVIGNPMGDHAYREGRGATGTSGHGLDKDPATEQWATRAAKDMGANVGTPVYAAFDGRISYVRDDKRAEHTGLVYGDQVWVGASGQVNAFYTHIDRSSDIVKGKEVHRGDVIGYVTHWDNPRASPHLHFALAVWQGDRWVGVDPSGMLAVTKGSFEGRELTLNADGTYSIGDETFAGGSAVPPRLPSLTPETGPEPPNYTRPDGLPGYAPGPEIPVATPANANYSDPRGIASYVEPPPLPVEPEPYTPVDANVTRPDGLAGRAEGPPPPPRETPADANYSDVAGYAARAPAAPAAPDPTPYTPAAANYTRPDGRPGEAEGPPRPPPPDPETPRDANYTGSSGQPEVAPAPPVAPPGPGPRSLDDGKNYTDETGRAVRAEDLPAKPVYRAPAGPVGPPDDPGKALSTQPDAAAPASMPEPSTTPQVSPPAGTPDPDPAHQSAQPPVPDPGQAAPPPQGADPAPPTPDDSHDPGQSLPKEVPVPIDPGLPSGSELASAEAGPATGESTPDVDTEPVDQDLGENYADA